MDIASVSVTTPIWAAAAAALAICGAIVLFRQIEMRRAVAAVIGLSLLLAAGLGLVMLLGGTPASRQLQQAGDAGAERRAIEARLAGLAAHAAMAGSPLACLDALAGEPVESACEQAVFASPASVAASVSYAAARLRLLADGIAYARKHQPDYAASLAELRLAAENDPYGIYAHVLATRDGCTPERCAAFALLRDSASLKVHLRQRVYATYVAQHGNRWGLPVRSVTAATAPPVAAAPPPDTTAAVPPAWSVSAAMPIPRARPTPATSARAEPEAAAPASGRDALAAEGAPSASRGLVPPAASVLPNIDFPSAASIPPISIMASEPKLPPAPAEAKAATEAAPNGSARPQ